MYASQHEEDKWVDEHWAELGLPDVGFFVEFGAGDGVHLSNTLFLETMHEWSGLLVEPDPRHVILQETRPNAIVERVAVGPRGSARIGLCGDPNLSGEMRNHRAKDARIRANDYARVQRVPLSDLLDQHGIERVHFVSVDVEGKELEAWSTLDLSRHRPVVAVVELLTWGIQDHSRLVIDKMQRDGYELIERTYHNGIFKST